MTRIVVGIAGWTYEPWRGVFYPEGLAQKREMEFASSALPIATASVSASVFSVSSGIV
jgi:uncharacterized protein YecE (DUF72 family)